MASIGVSSRVALLWLLCLDWWQTLGYHSPSWFLRPTRIRRRTRTTGQAGPGTAAARIDCVAGFALSSSTTSLGSVPKASIAPLSAVPDFPSSGSGMLMISLRKHLVSSSYTGTESSISDDQGESGTIRLILASQSPRRREILNMMGLKGRFLVVPPPADEAEIRERVQLRLSSTSPLPPLDPPEYARHLAGAKAAALAQHLVLELQEESAESSVSAAHTKWTIILGSDTIVDLDGSILEKPVDETDAGRMLKMLSGRRHSVHTGVALVCLGPRRGGDDGVTVATTTTTTSFVDTAVVQFASLTDEDIDAYVSTREPMDKAGSYGIQGIGGQMVRGIDGDFFTVMGLPMFRVSQELARLVQNLLED